MITKQIVDNQLYVYMNGSLMYKRWIKRDYGMIFCPLFGNFTAKESESFKQTIK